MTTRLGPYTLIERLATGGMAEIFRANREGEAGFQKPCVVKRILPHFAQDPQFIHMFLDEARLAAQLNHPNIVQIFELGGHDGTYFVAMEYVQGWPLSRALKVLADNDLRMPLPIGAWIVAKMCAGLEYAHGLRDASGEPLGLVHRDISPDNVLVTGAGEVKIIDFGIAKARGRETKTVAGTVKGKFRYMSPEQVTGRPVDRRSDLFSLGIVLYEVTTLGRPFLGDSDVMTATAIVRDDPTVPSVYLEGYPVKLERIILSALSKDLDARYQSAALMQTDLEDYLRSTGSYPTEREVGEYMARLMSGEAPDLAYLRAVPLGLEHPAPAPAAPAAAVVETATRPQARAAQAVVPPPAAAAPANAGSADVAPSPRAAQRGTRKVLFAALALVLAGAVAFGLYMLLRPDAPSTGTAVLPALSLSSDAGSSAADPSRSLPRPDAVGTRQTPPPADAAAPSAAPGEVRPASPVPPQPASDAVGASGQPSPFLRLRWGRDATGAAPTPADAGAAAVAPSPDATAPAPPPAQAWLVIPQLRPATTVSLDGQPQGAPPLRLKVAPGPHDVAFAQGGRTVVEHVEVAAGSEATVTPHFPAAATDNIGYLVVAAPRSLPLTISSVRRPRVNHPLPLKPGVYSIRYLSPSTKRWNSLTAKVRSGRTTTVRAF